MSGPSLRGFGVDLIACRVQESIERFYDLERVADVADYIVRGEREQLLVRHADDGVELRLELPDDDVVQIIEGVSHFVYVATRASQDRAATALEMEMQAEVDKWLLLAGEIESLDVERSAELRNRLFENVEYAHGAESELGERYRVANRTALRFLRRLERTHVANRRFAELRRELHEFFRSGQEEKLRLAQ
ncbi:MAG TPA: hypothetical protein VGH28_08080 [Polyangiaceae bacterium]